MFENVYLITAYNAKRMQLVQYLAYGNYERAERIKKRLMQYLVYERAESTVYAISNRIFRGGINEWCDTILEVNSKEYNWYYRDIDHSIKSISFARNLIGEEVFLHAHRRPCGDDPNYAIVCCLAYRDELNATVNEFRNNKHIEFYFINKISKNRIILIDDDDRYEKQLECIKVSDYNSFGDLELLEEPAVIQLPNYVKNSF